MKIDTNTATLTLLTQAVVHNIYFLTFSNSRKSPGFNLKHYFRYFHFVNLRKVHSGYGSGKRPGGSKKVNHLPNYNTTDEESSSCRGQSLRFFSECHSRLTFTSNFHKDNKVGKVIETSSGLLFR